MDARDIIRDGYERLNRLSPGETLAADDAAFGLRRLNLLVDELSAQTPFLSRQVLTSAAQTGHITLAAGAWAALKSGTQIVSVTQDGEPVDHITMEQYAAIHDPATTGAPTVWAFDGRTTVRLWNVPNGQTVQLLWLDGVSEFADLTTAYVLPKGYQNMLGAALAVRLAPTLLGSIPAALKAAEVAAKAWLQTALPSVVNVDGYGSSSRYNIESGL